MSTDDQRSSTHDDLEIHVDGARVISELHQLATHSECPDDPPAVTRIVYSPADLSAREYLRGLYEAAGLDVRVDSVGNTFARWRGTDADAPVVGTGSHCDAIPFSGMYDGTLGVIGGLEAIRTLQRSGFRPRRGIELLMITSEEPTRFAIGCVGSRVMASAVDFEHLGNLTDRDGQRMDDVRRGAGFAGEIGDSVLPPDYYHRWVELHIEQGPVLEREGIDIGIVTAIAAPATLRVIVEGIGGHAGGVLMPDRHDALCGASELVLAIEQTAVSASSDDLVATVGELNVHPGAVNSIPSRVTFTIDLRDINEDSRQIAEQSIRQSADAIARKRGLTIGIETLHADPPATCDDSVVAAAQQAAIASDASHKSMISRAYHDSLFIARIAPIGMIFIPCRGGVSHRPDEFSTPDQIKIGVEVLARTLAELSSQP